MVINIGARRGRAKYVIDDSDGMVNIGARWGRAKYFIDDDSDEMVNVSLVSDVGWPMYL